MHNKGLTLTASLLALFAAGPAQAGALPETAPLYFAANCANCHGTDGKGSGAIPALAGRDAAYLESTLLAYKAGSRPATIMQQLAKGYTDEEIARLAHYFAQQK